MVSVPTGRVVQAIKAALEVVLVMVVRMVVQVAGPVPVVEKVLGGQVRVARAVRGNKVRAEAVKETVGVVVRDKVAVVMAADVSLVLLF